MLHDLCAEITEGGGRDIAWRNTPGPVGRAAVGNRIAIGDVIRIERDIGNVHQAVTFHTKTHTKPSQTMMVVGTIRHAGTTPADSVFRGDIFLADRTSDADILGTGSGDNVTNTVRSDGAALAPHVLGVAPTTVLKRHTTHKSKTAVAIQMVGKATVANTSRPGETGSTVFRPGSQVYVAGRAPIAATGVTRTASDRLAVHVVPDILTISDDDLKLLMNTLHLPENRPAFVAGRPAMNAGMRAALAIIKNARYRAAAPIKRNQISSVFIR